MMSSRFLDGGPVFALLPLWLPLLPLTAPLSTTTRIHPSPFQRSSPFWGVNGERGSFDPHVCLCCDFLLRPFVVS